MESREKRMYMSIDVEAMGPNPSLHHLLIIAACVFDESKKLVDVFCYRIAKECEIRTDGKYIYAAESDSDTVKWLAKENKEGFEDALANGRSPTIVARELQKFIGGAMSNIGVKTYEILTDTTGFDVPFFDKILALAGDESVRTFGGNGLHNSVDVYSAYGDISFERDSTPLKLLVRAHATQELHKWKVPPADCWLSSKFEKHNPIMDAYCIAQGYFDKKK
jgi:hypothetical protein